MSFSFKHGDGVADQIRSIALEQIDKALAAAAKPDDIDKTIHVLRRRCKKLRGLLRLIQPSFADYARENRAVRDAAAHLSESRDAAVMLETFDGLGASEPGLRSRLEAARSGSVAADPAALIADFANRFVDLKARAERWEIDGKGFGALAPGLTKTYRRLRLSLAEAEDTGLDEDFHEWRKYVKYHWHHVTLLHRCAPDRLDPYVEALDTLGELLGDHHNLAVLGLWLDGQDTSKALRQLVIDRQADLADKALALGRQYAAETPRQMRQRFEALWALLPAKD